MEFEIPRIGFFVGWDLPRKSHLCYRHPTVELLKSLGATEHINWEANYQKIRKALGYEYPSYLLHESCNWSPYYKEWMFLPRRTSKEAYDEGNNFKLCHLN